MIINFVELILLTKFIFSRKGNKKSSNNHTFLLKMHFTYKSSTKYFEDMEREHLQAEQLQM